MSYAIIRNANYKRDNLPGLYKHTERKNTNYSNKDIDKNKSINNYSIKKCNTTYSNAIKQLIKENDLKCRITSYTNLVCEFIITSDKEFFNSIGEDETKRYFQTAYKLADVHKEDLLFVSNAGTYVDPVNANHVLKRICKNLDIKDVTSHSLRHTFATRCIEAGMRAVALKELMGHSDVSTTLNIYASVFNKFKNSELEKVNNYYMNNEIFKQEPQMLENSQKFILTHLNNGQSFSKDDYDSER